ncbi:unnamed protein product [Symbiodinium natans]|uniref:Uncharacterized protein n=1 Tax=Symbiodinium natans TaxID=878477 RepID=A0A812MS49_9DINO|nr:unnamed protein product [Symbiodinium natans]
MQVGYEGQFEGGKLATLVDADGYLAKTIIAGKRGQGTGRGGEVRWCRGKVGSVDVVAAAAIPKKGRASLMVIQWLAESCLGKARKRRLSRRCLNCRQVQQISGQWA